MDPEMREARRLAAQSTEPWDAVGVEVWEKGEPIGRMRSAQLARLVAAVHNQFLPAVNRLLLALRRLGDVQNMEKE